MILRGLREVGCGCGVDGCRCEDGTVAANFQLAERSHFGNPPPCSGAVGSIMCIKTPVQKVVHAYNMDIGITVRPLLH